MATIDVQKHFETEKTESNKELFSDVDLKEFNDLIKDKADFALLVKGFEDEKTIKEIQEVKGLKDVLETFVKTKTGLADIFKTEYDPTAKDQDLYEVCVLGAILTKGKVASADYKTEAKTYYESIKATKVETGTETKKEITETFVSGSSTNAEIAEKVDTEIKIEKWKNITEASVNVSAWADGDKMPLADAKQQLEEKKNELITLKKNFNDANQKIIQWILDELVAANIESKIFDKGTSKKDNKEQNGNRYLIASRLTGGLIEALKKFDITPEPTLNLKIDWDKCMIWNAKTIAGKEGERSFTMNVSMTITASTTEQKLDTPITKITTGTVATNTTTTGTTVTKTATTGTTGTSKTTVTKTATSGTGANAPTTTTTGEVDEKTIITTGGSGPNKGTETYKTKTKATTIETKESLESLKVKEDIARQFTFNGIIKSQNISDVIQDATDKNKYTVTINGYSDFVVKYIGENIEISTGTVKKWLLKWDIQETNLSVKIDKIKTTPETKDITVKLNATKSKEYVNTKLKAATIAGQWTYEVKEDADITEGSIKAIYKNATAIETTDGKEALDELTITLDKDNFLFTTGMEGNIPLTRQKVSWTKEVVGMDNYKIDDDTKKLSYYAKTEKWINDPSITIINNIIQYTEDKTTQKTTKTPLFKEYTNKITQERTVERYSEKIAFQYDTPETTTTETQFTKNANIEYKDKKYSLNTTFNIKDKTEPLILKVPVTYVAGNEANQNTSSLSFLKPTLSWTDDYNKIQGDKIMIDGIVYDLDVASKQQKNMPNIIFRHNTEKTLVAAEKRTDKYKIQSNIFSDKRTVDEKTQEGYEKINAGFGKCEFGPLTVTDGSWADPISYYKDVYVGQVKDKESGRILLQGTKIGTMFFWQHGKFLEYKTNETQKTFADQTDKADIATNTPTGIKNPLGQTDKNILLTYRLDETTNTINIDILNPKDVYSGTKTGKDFITDEKSTVDKFYRTIDIKPIIAENRINIHKALKNVASDDKDKIKKVFNLVEEKSVAANVVLWPDRNGVYAYKIVTENEENSAQYMYSRVDDGIVSLCNDDGEKITEQKIIIQPNNDFYKITVLPKTGDFQQFKIDGIEEEKQSLIPIIETDLDKDYKLYKGDLDENRSCNYWSTKKTDTEAYQFMCGKYTSLDIEVKDNTTIQGTDKIKDLSAFSLVDENQEGFGSYKNFFTTEKQENLGIDESIYKDVFTKILKEKETDTEKLVRVKYKKNGKFYYAPMYLDINKEKSGKRTFKLSESDGRKDAIEETEKRLENLVKAYSVFLEQDISTEKDTKWDVMRWWYLVKPTKEIKNKYFKNPESNIELFLKTNNQVGGEYQETKIIFDPIKESVEPTEITINTIKYSLAVKPDSELWYKVVIKKWTLDK